MTITLYELQASPHARKVRLLASELGIPLTKVACDPRIGETRTSDFLARNPNGRVPTLEEDGFVLWNQPATRISTPGSSGSARSPIGKTRSPPSHLAAVGRFGSLNGAHIVLPGIIERHVSHIVMDAAGIAEGVDRLWRMEAIAVPLVDLVAHLDLAARLRQLRDFIIVRVGAAGAGANTNQASAMAGNAMTALRQNFNIGTSSKMRGEMLTR